jgi:hypothetical protein
MSKSCLPHEVRQTRCSQGNNGIGTLDATGETLALFLRRCFHCRLQEFWDDALGQENGNLLIQFSALFAGRR